MTDNLINFPKNRIIIEDLSPVETKAPYEDTHHEEIFEYDDGSYVVLVLPKGQIFTVEKMVFMAERLKRCIFDYAECSCDDEDQAPVDHPPYAS